MDLLHKDGVLGKVLNTVLPGVFLLSVTVRWRSPLLTVDHTFSFTLSHFQFHTFSFTLSFSGGGALFLQSSTSHKVWRDQTIQVKG